MGTDIAEGLFTVMVGIKGVVRTSRWNVGNKNRLLCSLRVFIVLSRRFGLTFLDRGSHVGVRWIIQGM